MDKMITKSTTEAGRIYILAALPLLILIIFLSSASMISPALAQASFSREEALTKAYEHIRQNFGYEKEELGLGSLEFFEGQWAFSAILKEHSSTQDGLIIGIMNDKGGLMDIRGPMDLSLDMQIEESLKSSLSDLEKMFAFKQAWSPMLEALIQSGQEEKIEGIYPRYIQVINLNISLPKNDDIAREEALEKAKDAIAGLPGWTQDKIDYYNIMIELHYTPDDIQKPVYQFVFQRRSRLEQRYDGPSGEMAYEKYEKKLFAAFGGDNLSAPWFVSVMLNARTGELVEEPVIECPPTESHYLDFILR